MDPTIHDLLAQAPFILRVVLPKILGALSLAFPRTNGLASVVVNQGTSEYCHSLILILLLN